MSRVSEIEKLMTPCQDREHLAAWIKKYTGLDFPGKTVSRFSDCNPLEFIWIVYQHVMEGKPGMFLSLSGRDSFKTLSLSVIDLLVFLHDSRNIVHLAMTTAQGNRARAYLENFVLKNQLIRDAVIKQNTKELTLLINNEKVGMEILSATPKQVQGSHASFVSWDEVASSMEPQNVKAYKDSSGILGSSHKGKPAIVVKITSRQAGYSLAEQELRNAAQSGLKVFKWTTLDATERCPDERSGIIPTPLWVDVMKGDKYTQSEYPELSDSKKATLTLTNDTFDKCRSCHLCGFCQGDLKKQESNSKLLRTIDDVINKIQLSGSWEWASAQLMSLKPSTEGLVYFEFDRQIHIPGWNKMWEVLTGDQPQFEITRDKFIEELKKRGANFYAGVDWGWSSPSTCVVVAIDSREMIYVIEALGRTYTNDPDFIQLIKATLHKKYDIQMYCPDLANGSGNSLLRQAGLPTTDEVDKTAGSVNRGINVLKGLLRVPGSNGMARIFLAPDLDSNVPGIPGIGEEFELYHKKQDAAGKIMDNDNPEPENDHYLDALRYLIVWLFGRMRMKVGTDYEKRKNPNRPQSNIPSVEEISRQFGFQYNDNRPEEEKDEDLDGSSGPIFTWT